MGSQASNVSRSQIFLFQDFCHWDFASYSPGSGVWGLESGVWGLGLRVWGLGSGVWGAEFCANIPTHPFILSSYHCWHPRALCEHPHPPFPLPILLSSYYFCAGRFLARGNKIRFDDGLLGLQKHGFHIETASFPGIF